MSIKRTRWLILALFIALLLAGCRCDNSLIPTYYGIGDTPADGAVTSLTPLFNWHGSDSCDPDEYIFRIEEGGISSQGLVNTNISPSNLPYTYVGGVGSPLEPGKSYTWYLTAVNGANNGDPPVFGQKTEIGQFFTGPVCSTETLIAPDLMDPEPAGWLNKEHVFKWTYPGGCLPTTYQVQFAWDAAFTNIYLTATTSEPYAQELLMAFPDCSTLFWRVRAFDGSTYGPWSAGRDFHYIISGGCYQWHYLSDDAARIYVDLYWDDCSQTGYNASTNTITDPGCKADDISTIIVADGERVFPPSDYGMGGFEVDLGSGPCPSTGLDHKSRDQLPFNVLAPGTYCVSITRDQTIDGYPHAYLMDGIWSEPRTNDVVAYQTVEVGPGTSDILVEFGWDEYDLVFVMPEFDFTIECRFCPDPIGPVTGFLFAEQPVPIYGRDWQSHWKLSEVEGKACYALISDALIDEALEKFDGFELRSADLGQYPPPPPCPPRISEPGVSEPRQNVCSDYKDSTSCNADTKCIWKRPLNAAGSGYCTTK
jgi:hypothetical protein